MGNFTDNFRNQALRRGILLRPRNDAPVNKGLSTAAIIELANLGFLVDPNALVGVSVKDLEAILKEAREVVGADRAMTPIYPGFPKQVEDMDTLTLLFEQVLHYWTGGAFLPNYSDVAREGLPLEDMLRNARTLEVMTAGDAARKFATELVSNPVAISESDRELLEGCLNLLDVKASDLVDFVKEARNGENIQALVNVVKGYLDNDEILEAVLPQLRNLDAVLRVVLSLYGSVAGRWQYGAGPWVDNFNLAVNTLADHHARAIRMGKISRPARRLIMNRVGELSTGFKADALVSRMNLWRTVFRAVHPYDVNSTKAARNAADIVHSNVDYRTLNSLVEEGMANRDVVTVVGLLADNAPGNLLRRLVAILRLVKSDRDAQALANAVRNTAVKSTLTTLISAYNGVISANDDAVRVTRVAGLNNTMLDRKAVVKVDNKHVEMLASSIMDAITEVLVSKNAPEGVVGIKSNMSVPLVRRDAATTDRVLDRGQEVTVAGEGDTLRVFGHWVNNQSRSGYMDIGVVVTDDKFNHLAVSTWDTWAKHRAWSTYSGDKHVYPGDNAAEYIDVNLKKLRETYPNARWAIMTIQSWSGFPMNKVDFIAGAMLRSDSHKGEVFDARTVASAFKPTTTCLQSVPFAVDLNTGALIWVDSSNGSMLSGVSSSGDTSIGSIVYDEIARPRLTMGDLAGLWAKAHDAKVDANIGVDRDAILGLL